MTDDTLKVCCWKWRPYGQYRSEFGATQVNTLRSMVKRNLKLPHEFVCITDDPTGIDKDIRIVPLWKNPVVQFGSRTKPNCLRRLKAFSPEMEQVIGKRFVWIDLDAVITDDITLLFEHDHDFMIWGGTNPTHPYNGSMVMMNAGARKQVWENFDPVKSPLEIQKRGLIGSDQAWIYLSLGGQEKMWGTRDGILSFRNDLLPTKNLELPFKTRIVFFHGQHDPWHPYIQHNYSWVREHYR